MIEKFDIHLIIRRVVTKRQDHLLDDALMLWERFALELVPIIGEGGFESLYMRSLMLTCARFPWMSTVCSAESGVEYVYVPFSELVITLKKHDSNEAGEAIITLLVVFTDILATLIGTSLTTRILGAAWGEDAIDLTGMEY